MNTKINLSALDMVFLTESLAITGVNAGANEENNEFDVENYSEFSEIQAVQKINFSPDINQARMAYGNNSDAYCCEGQHKNGTIF